MAKNDWKGMLAIELTQNQFAIVDEEDYDFLNQYKWYADYQPGIYGFYARRNLYLGVIDGKEKWKAIMMHRLIMERFLGRELERREVIDHINHDSLDNRRCNLRVASQRQNTQNRNEKSSSKYPGVYWHNPTQKWHAQITINGKRKHLGLFVDEREAAKAYEEACREQGEELICKAKSKVRMI
jgi:hypothetical protein